MVFRQRLETAAPLKRLIVVCSAAALLAGCGSQLQQAVPGSPPSESASLRARTGTQRKIQNLIVIVQEDRSFDNLFAGYPNADAPTYGYTAQGKRVTLKTITLHRDDACTILDDDFDAFRIAYNHGKMNGWNRLDRKDPLCPYTRVDHAETLPYWNLAKQYVLADKFFSSTRFDAFVEQLYIIAGTTKIAPSTFDIGLPTDPPGNCDSREGTVTSLLDNGLIEFNEGPFPCFTQFPTIANLLDAAHVGWRYYTASSPAQDPWDAFAAIQYVSWGKDRKRNIAYPATKVLTDLAGGKLATVSWVISPPPDSDAPGSMDGPAWVQSIVTAAQKSTYWAHTAIVVVWSGSGKVFYDDARPPQLDAMGSGFRVPMIVVSPYAKRGYVSHTQYEFGSILKFIEQNWNLGSLGATDQRANSIGDVFKS
jgi:phospholipase C